MLMNKTKTVDVELEVSTSAYTAGDVVGGLITLDVSSAGGGGLVRRVILVDDDAENAAYNLHLFDAAPTAIADGDAYAPAIGDLQKLVGTVVIGSYSTYNSNSVAIVGGVDVEYTGATLYGYLVCTGTPTYTSADDLMLRVMVWMD